jgi:hypothetical protein
LIQEFALKPLDNLEAARLEIRTGKYQAAFTSVDKKKKEMGSTSGTVEAKYIVREKHLGGGGKAVIS